MTNEDDKNYFKEIDELRNPEIATARLTRAIRRLAEDEDAEAFLVLLRKLTKAHGGMSRLSKKIGINRQNLYRTFASTGNPKFKSLSSILRGLGYRLSVEAVPLDRASRQEIQEAA